jgi:rhodanese-related sulfurtransferase
VALMLSEAGLKDVHYLKGGFDAWRRLGYPVVDKAAS